MVRIRRISKQPTKMVRVRIKDIQRLKEMADVSQKKLPDFVSELVKLHYSKRRRIWILKEI